MPWAQNLAATLYFCLAKFLGSEIGDFLIRKFVANYTHAVFGLKKSEWANLNKLQEHKQKEI